jgi:HPt (histidine-containing phosphotransfer) domain-containing protein
VQAQVLLAMLQQVTVDGATAAAADPDAVSPIDPDEVLARVDGDRELLSELTQIFHHQARELMVALEVAVSTGDARQVEQVAHTLRGSVANFGAEDAVDLAQALELRGRSGQLADAADLVAQLRLQTAGIEVALASLSGVPQP